MWHQQLWAIDHGACLYFHHSWSGGIGSPERFAHQPYDASDHVLGAYVGGVAAADAQLAPQVTADLLHDVVDQVPDEWLQGQPVSAAFLGFLLLITAAAAWSAWRAVRDRGDVVRPIRRVQQRLGARRDVAAMVQHDLADTRYLLERATELDDDERDRIRFPGLVVLEWDGPEESVSRVLGNLVRAKEVWLASMAGADSAP